MTAGRCDNQKSTPTKKKELSRTSPNVLPSPHPSISLPRKPENPIRRRERCCEAPDAHRDEIEAMSRKAAKFACRERAISEKKKQLGGGTAFFVAAFDLVFLQASTKTTRNFAAPGAPPPPFFNTTTTAMREREGERIREHSYSGVGGGLRPRPDDDDALSTSSLFPQFLQSPPPPTMTIPSSPPPLRPPSSPLDNTTRMN